MALATGEIFTGVSFGFPGMATGEVVFNTAMTGYQEILTDPSYRGQLVCLTAPHVGIVGINERDAEAPVPQAQALIVRDLARTSSSWRAEADLAQHCSSHQITGISDIDTRLLTRRLRDGGTCNGCITTETDPAAALVAAQDCIAMEGNPLGATAGVCPAGSWQHGVWDARQDNYAATTATGPKIAVLDCGSKQAILRELANRGLRVTVVPYKTTAAEITNDYAGVVFSNGPGDPQPLNEAATLAQELLERGVPLLGICLGHQILAQAAGAKIYKMKFGHHGTNHPIHDLVSGQVAISSQNHGFAVAAEDLPAELEITHTSLFDGSIAGFRHKNKPLIAFQGHPEASPGPRELNLIFDRFVKLVTEHA